MEEATELTDKAPRTQEEASPANGTALTDSDAPRASQVEQVNPLAPDEGRYVSLEEYWEKWYENPYPDIDVSYEWNNGRLEAVPPSNMPQLNLYNWFFFLLYYYLETHEIADLINMGTGFLLTMEDAEEESGFRQAVRKPDIGVILRSNPVSWGRIDQYSYEGVCDAVVESLSDATLTEVLRDTEEKKRDYALAGVKEYIILDPSGEHMRFYRLAPTGVYEEIEPGPEAVIHSAVLPGFQFRLEDLARQPKLEELALDDVYFRYVIPDFRANVTGTTEAKARTADAAVRRADLEAQRADLEAAARQQVEERAQAAEERIQALEAEMAARQQTEEERIQALVEAELARLRGQDS